MIRIFFDEEKFKEMIESSSAMNEEDLLIRSIINCMIEKRVYDLDFTKINSNILNKISNIIKVDESPIIHNIVRYSYLKDYVLAISPVYKVGDDEVW